MLMNTKSLWLLILAGPLWLGFGLGTKPPQALAADKPYYEGKTITVLISNSLSWFSSPHGANGKRRGLFAQ